MSDSSFTEKSIEKVKKYWDQRPCNIRHSPEPVGTRKYFDEVEARKYFVEPHIPRFAEFERWRGKEVLEIGCGIGTDTVNFARSGARVTAVELSPKSMAIARQRVEVYGLNERVKFYEGSAEELASFLPIKTFDLVYAFGVIHHTPHPERVLEQLRNYVRPGTILKIMVYHRRSWKVFWAVMKYGKGNFRNVKEIVARHSEAQTGSPVTYTYTRREARRLLEGHGFRVTEMWVDHIFPYRVSEYVQYRYRRALGFRLIPPPLFRWLERRVGWHLCITAEAC
jgi:2-polyprenyl-3-methyl-5-hydroxy-6-metoxy-1,4-benzoquinol methylase